MDVRFNTNTLLDGCIADVQLHSKDWRAADGPWPRWRQRLSEAWETAAGGAGGWADGCQLGVWPARRLDGRWLIKKGGGDAFFWLVNGF